MEQWADSITAVLDDLGSTEAVLVPLDGSLPTAALFAATYPSRTTALVFLEGFAYAGDRAESVKEEALAAMAEMWGTSEIQHMMNPDMPWNEEIRAAWSRAERLAASPATLALMTPLVAELGVQAVLPTVRVPTLVVPHADDYYSPPALGKKIADQDLLEPKLSR
ncbi:alpha/beta fold hydrolase [Mycolicibacterium elephantis]